MPKLTHYLATDEYLRNDEFIVSRNKKFYAALKPDGYFAIYRGSGPHDSQGKVWESPKGGSGNQFFAYMQTDGNFVVYSGTGPTDNKGAVWATGGTGQQGKYVIVLQDDGNLGLYRSSPADPTQPEGGSLWNAGVRYSLSNKEYLRTNEFLCSRNGFFFAVLKPDGNLAVFRGSGPKDSQGYLWGSGKTSAGPHFAYMQTDGNFVIYDGSGPDDRKAALWATDTDRGQGNYVIVLQDDGNLCLYRASQSDPKRPLGAAIWDSAVTDPVVRVNVRRLDYTGKGTKDFPGTPVALFLATLRNDMDREQQMTINRSESIALSRSWSNSLSISAGVSVTGEVGVPGFGTLSATVSLEATATLELGGSSLSEHTWDFSVPVTLAPRETATVLVSVTKTTVRVPYEMEGSTR